MIHICIFVYSPLGAMQAVNTAMSESFSFLLASVDWFSLRSCTALRLNQLQINHLLVGSSLVGNKKKDNMISIKSSTLNQTNNQSINQSIRIRSSVCLFYRQPLLLALDRQKKLGKKRILNKKINLAILIFQSHRPCGSDYKLHPCHFKYLFYSKI